MFLAACVAFVFCHSFSYACIYLTMTCIDVLFGTSITSWSHAMLVLIICLAWISFGPAENHKVFGEVIAKAKENR